LSIYILLSKDIEKLLYFGGMESLATHISTIDWILGFMYLLFIVMGAWLYKYYKHRNDPAYKYFIPGLIAKIGGGLAFVLIYAYYYGGGDINSYYLGSKALVNLTFEDFGATMQMLGGGNSSELRSAFTYDTGVPFMYIFGDPKTWAVCRFSYPFMLLSFNHLIPATILINAFSFIGLWQFYRMLSEKFPNQRKQMAFAALFIPSCLFWGSGLIKDTYTLSATLWLFAIVHNILEKRRTLIYQIVLLVVNSYIIIVIKPYIFVALLPALVIWLSFSYLKKIKNRLLRYILTPVLLLSVTIGGSIAYFSMDSSLGQYGNVQEALKKAEVTQKDLTQGQYYGENYYDIGEFDATLSSTLSKFPIATMYGAFGPFIWQANSPVILISAIESSVLLGLFVLVILQFRRKKVWKKLSSDGFLLGALAFSLIFLFFVGLSSGNFGALVRYRIPALPLLWALILYLLYSNCEKENNSL
jgi:hypothetical protein